MHVIVCVESITKFIYSVISAHLVDSKEEEDAQLDAVG